MYTPQFVSQQSYDLDMYLPPAMDLKDALIFQSADALMDLLDFGPDITLLAHRTESPMFNPLSSDIKASVALTKHESLFVDDRNGVQPYSFEGSAVVPHTSYLPKESAIDGRSPLSPSRTDKYDIIQTFLVFDATTGRQRRPLLHEFIRLVVENEDYSHIAEYVDRQQDIFKLHKPKEISELWKQVKGRNSDNKMTYDKLARAIRYYYGSGIIISSPGRFTFRFGSKSGFGVTWWPAR